MNEPKHTPTPWRITGYGIIGGIEDGSGQTVAQAQERPSRKRSEPDHERLANAAFIVRACNAHDALVEALVEIREKASSASAWNAEGALAACEALAESALALARGE